MIPGWAGLGNETEVEDLLLPIAHVGEYVMGGGALALGAALDDGGSCVAHLFAEADAACGTRTPAGAVQFVVRLAQRGTFACVLVDRVQSPATWQRCGGDVASAWAACGAAPATPWSACSAGAPS